MSPRTLHSERTSPRAEGTPEPAPGAAVLQVGLDNVRALNALYGWGAVDKLLEAVYGDLSHALPTAAVSRIGQDRYEIVLSGEVAGEARFLAERARKVVRRREVHTGAVSLRATASVGVGAGAADEPLSELRLAADFALAEAKRLGRDRVVLYDPRTRAELWRTSHWAERVRRGVEDEGFELHAQPVVELATGHVTHWEILVRLRTAEGPLLPPAEFLPTATRFGLVEAVDRWVVRRALKLLAGAEDRNLVVELNVSVQSLRNPEFLTLVEWEASELGADPRRLVIDIAEGDATDRTAELMEVVTGLDRLGCRVALDNFGRRTGSLALLQVLPLDFVKLDDCFVQDLASNTRDQGLVASLAGLAGGLGIESIACFVPDPETVELLLAAGIRFGQGFHLGAPRPVTELG